MSKLIEIYKNKERWKNLTGYGKFILITCFLFKNYLIGAGFVLTIKFIIQGR